MKKMFAILLVSLMVWLPVASQAAEGTAQSDSNVMLLGIGAIAGVVAFNYLTGGLEALPFVGGPMVLEGRAAANRVVMVASAVAGVWIADWLNRNVTMKK
ncbi:conserved membrane hypothetical protein [Gammaproteobacteria bacterium]